jgi:hypothetical protein
MRSRRVGPAPERSSAAADSDEDPFGGVVLGSSATASDGTFTSHLPATGFHPVP